jgi:hypothetical protein
MIGMYIGLGVAILLVLLVGAGCIVCYRRAEHAANRADAAKRNAHQFANEARQAQSTVMSLVTKYADAPAPILPEPPKCPLDGEPLIGYDRPGPGYPARFQHADGTVHTDHMAEIRDQRRAPAVAYPGVYPPPDAQPLAQQLTQQPEQASTVDTYFQRVSNAVEANLIDPDKLRDGIAEITRDTWTPTPLLAAPDTTVAQRAGTAKPMPPPEGPIYPNGDGS